MQLYMLKNHSMLVYLGAGSVRYKGNPKIKKDISGAGSIKKI